MFCLCSLYFKSENGLLFNSVIPMVECILENPQFSEYEFTYENFPLFKCGMFIIEENKYIYFKFHVRIWNLQIKESSKFEVFLIECIYIGFSRIRAELYVGLQVLYVGPNRITLVITILFSSSDDQTNPTIAKDLFKIFVKIF